MNYQFPLNYSHICELVEIDIGMAVDPDQIFELNNLKFWPTKYFTLIWFQFVALHLFLEFLNWELIDLLTHHCFFVKFF